MAPRRTGSRVGPIDVHRIYDDTPTRGKRYLVERLWPRGVTKAQARLDGWLRDAAPSTELRRWFGHDRAKWETFRRRYFAELDADPQALRPLLDELSRGRPVTLLFSARETEHNNAVALKEYLLRHRASGVAGRR